MSILIAAVGGLGWWCGVAASVEALDDDHAAAAAGAGSASAVCGSLALVLMALMASTGMYRRREQFAGAGDVLGTFAAGEQAIVADAVEACGQHVDQEAADELVRVASVITL